MTGSWRERVLVAESSVTLLFAVVWEAEQALNKLSDPAQEVTELCVEGAVRLLPVAYVRRDINREEDG